jgi:SPP1 family predicted phage head-tail adaptor
MAVSKTIPAGLLNKPITFKQPSSLKNDEGGVENTYSEYLTTRAYVEGFNQYRTTEADAAGLIGAKDFYIRWSLDRETINKDFLIEYKGLDWTIHKIETIEEKQKFLRFTAKVKE